MKHYELKEFLEGLYSSYKHKFSSKDPVWNVHKFSDEKDIELAGFLSAAFAYGSVDQINIFIEHLLSKTGYKPYEFTINFQKRKDKKHFKGLYYRFNTEDDIINIFSVVNKILIEHSSLKNAFMANYNRDDDNIINALRHFIIMFKKYSAAKHDKYYHYLLPDPEKGSTCKRMNLFLRWMVRKDEIDFGIWNGVNSSKLIMPVDTHIARVSNRLKLVKRKTVDLKFAIELTEKLRQFDKNDPVRFDFALCHAGIEKKNYFRQ
jgi:uncharacterized protein (TIGR02757 family)